MTNSFKLIGACIAGGTGIVGTCIALQQEGLLAREIPHKVEGNEPKPLSLSVDEGPEHKEVATYQESHLETPIKEKESGEPAPSSPDIVTPESLTPYVPEVAKPINFKVSISGEADILLQCRAQAGKRVVLKVKGDNRLKGRSEYGRGSVTHIVLDCEGFEEDKKLPDLKELRMEKHYQSSFVCTYTEKDRNVYGVDTYKYSCRGGQGRLTGRLVKEPNDGKNEYIELVDRDSKKLWSWFVQ